MKIKGQIKSACDSILPYLKNDCNTSPAGCSRTAQIICLKEIELPPEIEEPLPEDASYSSGASYSSFDSYSPRGTSRQWLKPMANSNIHRMIIRPLPRKMSHTYATTYPMFTSTTTTTTTTTMTSTTPTSTFDNRRKLANHRPTRRLTITGTTRRTTSTTTTTTTTTPIVHQTKINEITLEFSNLLKSSLFQQHLTEVHAGDQIIKTIEFELPPKIKMEFTLNLSGEVQKICLNRTLFDHNIARLLFKRELAAKLSGLNELEKTLLSC